MDDYQTVNQTRGNGVRRPYDEVRFLDNSLPSQAVCTLIHAALFESNVSG